MEIRPIYFFSLVKNINEYCKKEKDVDLDALVHPIVYARQKDHVIQRCKYIWNEYENAKFTLKQFKLYVLYKNLICDNFFILNVNVGEIKDVVTLFTKAQYAKDKLVVINICKNINIKNIGDFFKIAKEDGTNVAVDLVKRQVISPILFIKYLNKIEQQDLKFKRATSKLKIILEDQDNG